MGVRWVRSRFIQDKTKLIITFLTLLFFSCFLYHIIDGYTRIRLVTANWHLSLLSHIFRLVPYCFIFFLIVSYGYSYKIRRQYMIEGVTAYPQGELGIWRGSFFFLSTLASFVTIITIIIVIILTLNSGLRDLRYCLHVLTLLFLGLFIVQMIAILLGLLLSRVKRKLKAYLLLILILYLFIPKESSFLGLLPVSRIGFSSYINNIRSLFSIFTPGIYEPPLSIFGYSLLPYRFGLALFWIAALSFLNLFLIDHTRSRRRGSIPMLLLAFIGFSIFCFAPTRVIQSDTEPFTPSRLIDDSYYAKKGSEQKRKADFKLLSMDMTLKIGPQLRGKARVTLAEPLPDHLRFTLYHGYRVSGVYDGSGNSIDFEQDGDYLTIRPQSSLERNQIVLNYRGSAPRFMSNCQAISLPGHFPYYPIPGHHPLFTKNAAIPTFMPVIMPQEVPFNVHVVTSHKVYSNLERIEDNTFSGKSNGVSLVAGFLAETVIDGRRIVYPFLEGGYENDSSIKDTLQSLANEIKLSPGKTILHHNPLSTSSSENTAEFSDHYITPNFVKMLLELPETSLADNMMKNELFKVYERIINDEKMFYYYLAYMTSKVQNIEVAFENARGAYKRQLQLAMYIDRCGAEAVLALVDEYLNNDEDLRTIDQFFMELSLLAEQSPENAGVPYYKRYLIYLFQELEQNPEYLDEVRREYLELKRNSDPYLCIMLRSNIAMHYVAKMEEIGADLLNERIHNYLKDHEDTRPIIAFLKDQE